MKYHSIDELLNNNQAWVAEKLALNPNYFEQLATGQKPPYLYIGCSDSRLPLTNFTRTEPGELFVHRNIANQVSLTDINFLAVLEYAISHLQVQHIIVCGHYGCGGIKAALEGKTIGIIDNWVNPIREIYLQNQDDIDALLTKEERLNRLAEINVLVQVKNLYQTSIMRKALYDQKAPVVHGWVLDIRTGLIKDLQVSTKQWELRPPTIVLESIPSLPDFKFLDGDLDCLSQEAC
ncbi:MAG: carbonic anhydrase [Brasilonema octagenarum HA4186-MV1]|jgi:carbonic anhydrase|uniref:Carbonic anhydrase n=1 Tax=Brasilonema octagenarum UFV-OR1 TaxID=417115 RepID=A0ABX1MA55_9CYAN|nr:carbonic anhydrase [Brasilonema octagenarum]MBW4624829.1 carbonic anhydrase [Brasilonema octagenarum HA4186-MV1]NMF64381.1 carbonic anhydrase [Brasilonema octagenarum UFV-OR1]